MFINYYILLRIRRIFIFSLNYKILNILKLNLFIYQDIIPCGHLFLLERLFLVTKFFYKIGVNMTSLSFEQKLWKSCDKLRGSVEPSEYKHVVLGLIFLKYAGDRFEQQQEKLIEDGDEQFINIPSFYVKDNVFFLPENSRWSYIMENAKQDNIALILDTAFNEIEKNNDKLRGALPNNYYSRIELETNKLSSLLDEINGIDTAADNEQDFIGRVYEYFLSQFAIKEGKGKGEFYTPKSVVNLIAEIIEPYDGTIYDPCCGSGGMFVQSLKFIESHHGNTKNISVYGQELTATTRRLALMNLAIRGISENLGEKAADTFFNDQHKDQRFDYIMANPPFNLKDWREENQLITDYRWSGYEVPPKSNANYAWILHMVSKLSDNGMAGFILSNGSLSDSGVEYEIRKKLIEKGLIESIIILPRKLFYSTDISVTLWIINKNKTKRTIIKNNVEVNYRNRINEILFLDLRQFGSPFEKRFIELTEEDIDKVVETIKNWQQENTVYENIPEFSYSASIDEVREKDYSLVPSQYIEFVNKDIEIDFDKEMKILRKDFKKLLIDEKNSSDSLKSLFKEIGYDMEL